MVLPFRNIHAALDLMKRCIFVQQLSVFLLSRCGSGSASGQKYIQLVDPGNVCQNPRISEIEERSMHHFFPCTQAHIFKFYSVEMIDDVYEILLHFMDFYLQKTKSCGDRWRLPYILAVPWEA